jgi:hypothetical protein
MHRHACFTRPSCRGYPRLSLFVLAANLTLRGALRMTRGKGGRGNRRPPPCSPALALLSLASASGRTGPNRPAPVMTVMTAMTAMAAMTVIDPPRPKACPRRRHALGHRSRRRPTALPQSGARVPCTDVRRRRERLVRGRVERRDVVSRGQVGFHFPLGGELTHRRLPHHDVDRLLEAPED